jgi:hypothetical protein
MNEQELNKALSDEKYLGWHDRLWNKYRILI